MLKFETSESQENLYVIYRMYFRFIPVKIGSASIEPGHGFTISPTELNIIGDKDLIKIEEHCKKLAHLEGYLLNTEII